jgi:antitoxin (DNA-binding transcriptional repressor) of toxin-antitoxin stability system
MPVQCLRDLIYGSTVVITKNGVPVAELGPAKRRPDTLFGALRGSIKITGEIGILSTEVEDFHGDPADRIIAATAVVHGATLITADSRILARSGTLGRHDARI